MYNNNIILLYVSRRLLCIGNWNNRKGCTPNCVLCWMHNLHCLPYTDSTVLSFTRVSKMSIN